MIYTGHFTNAYYNHQPTKVCTHTHTDKHACMHTHGHTQTGYVPFFKLHLDKGCILVIIKKCRNIKYVFTSIKSKCLFIIFTCMRNVPVKNYT